MFHKILLLNNIAHLKNKAWPLHNSIRFNILSKNNGDKRIELYSTLNDVNKKTDIHIKTEPNSDKSRTKDTCPQFKRRNWIYVKVIAIWWQNRIALVFARYPIRSSYNFKRSNCNQTKANHIILKILFESILQPRIRITERNTKKDYLGKIKRNTNCILNTNSISCSLGRTTVIATISRVSVWVNKS